MRARNHRSDEIAITELAAALVRECEVYAETQGEGMAKAIKKAASNTRKRIKQNSKRHKNGPTHPPKHYADDWATRTESGDTGTTATVYNKNHYHLAHLLENGYAKRNGGRVAGDHVIADAYSEAEAQLVKELGRL